MQRQTESREGIWQSALASVLRGQEPPLEQKAQLSAPELFVFADAVGKHFYGCDQDWYRTVWQRRAGCGPSTAANLTYYMSQRRPAWSALYPYPISSERAETEFLKHMEVFWEYVTPGMQGVDRISMLSEGVLKYARERGVQLQAKELAVPRKRTERPTNEAVFEFLADSLSRDLPVPFLNLSSGGLLNLDSWHWTLIIGLYCHNCSAAAETESEEPIAIQDAESGPAAAMTGAWQVLLMDSGSLKLVDLARWLPATRLGGGFVRFSELNYAERQQQGRQA